MNQINRRPLIAICRFFALTLLLGAAAADAHRLRAALTTVLFNERTDRIEVMHRFYLHDAEQVAGEIAGRSANLFENEEDRQRFGIYVHERFEVVAADGEPLPLTLRGTEIDGEFLWVYEATGIPAPLPTAISIRNHALRDFWPDQVNTVNIEGLGPVRTLTFRDTVSTLTVDLDQP